MTRSKCGLLLLLAAATACGGDPTESFREAGQKIVANPSVVFVDHNASVFVVAELVDSQGNQLATSFDDPADVGSTITVVKDSTFLETTNGTTLATRERFIVTGLTPSSTSFTISGGGHSLEVPVSVLPTSVAATFSNPAPAVNEPVTITLPEGYTFSSDATVESSLGAGFVQSVSPDGTSLAVVIPPGSTGPVTLSGVTAAFLPTVPLTIPSVDEVAASTTPLAGTATTATAPEVPVPALDGTSSFFDTGTWTGADITGDGGLGAQYYKFTVTETGKYNFLMDWAGGADLDPVVCFDPACAAIEFAGTGVDHPEEGELTLEPGTYYFASVLFDGAAPPFFSLSITHSAPTTGD